MKTGDLLICQGNGALSKQIISAQKVFCKLQKRPITEAVNISHVAIVVELFEKNYVFESTTLNDWCGKKGVQVNPYDKWVANYNGKVWIREGQPVPEQDVFAEKAVSYLSFPYENGIPGGLELLLSGIDFPCFRWLARRMETHKGIYCSEVIVNLLKAQKMLWARLNEHKMPPMEFYGNGRFDMHLVNGFTFDKPKQIEA